MCYWNDSWCNRILRTNSVAFAFHFMDLGIWKKVSQGFLQGCSFFHVYGFICYDSKCVIPCQQELQSAYRKGVLLQNGIQRFLYNGFSFEVGLVIQKLHMFLMEVLFGHLEFGKICSYYPCHTLSLWAVFGAFYMIIPEWRVHMKIHALVFNIWSGQFMLIEVYLPLWRVKVTVTYRYILNGGKQNLAVRIFFCASVWPIHNFLMGC